MRITIDRVRCIAAGQCVMKAPDVFDQNEDDGIVVLLNPNPPEALRQAVLTAARCCPSEAIHVHEE